MTSSAVRLPLSQPPARAFDNAPLRGLLVTSDSALARAFRRELKRAGRIVPLEVHPSLEHAHDGAGGRFAWITIDLDGVTAPSRVVRMARRLWPRTLLAVLSYRWSDREHPASKQADHVIHKPVRAAELDALFHSLGGVLSGKNGARPTTTAELQDGLRPVR